MVLACVIPLVLLLVMPNEIRDGLYFALLSFAPASFAGGVLLVNRRKGNGSTHCDVEH